MPPFKTAWAHSETHIATAIQKEKNTWYAIKEDPPFWAVSQGVKPRSPVGLDILVLVQGAVGQGVNPRSPVGINALVLVQGAVS